MAFIDWQDWMETGIPLVDADHKVLISLINQVHSCLGDNEQYGTLGSVLKALEDYTDYHFQREETLLAEVNFPGLVAHKQLHARLAAQVGEMVKRFQAAQGSAVRAQDILNFLKVWLTDHILEQDMGYRRFVIGQDDAQLAAAAVGMGHIRGASAPRSFDWLSKRILVVDDNPNFLILMETILSGVGAGYVKTARSAVEGLAVMASQAVDAVISDWYMAEMDGLEFVTKIRSSVDPVIANVCVLMVSGRSDAEVREKAVSAGVDDFLEKPVSARDLLLTLARVITARG